MKEKQIGCGYCIEEKKCKKREPKINKAKLGCEDYKYYLQKHKENK